MTTAAPGCARHVIRKAVLVAKPGGPNTGVGRYVHMLQRGLQEVRVEVSRVAPIVPPFPAAGYAALSHARVDLRTFLTNYPVWAEYPTADIYHLTSQNLASLLVSRRPRGRVVVTVHDIIPFMLRGDAELSSYRTIADRIFDRLAMTGLKRADRIMSDSHYTKRCLIEQLGIPASRIDVVYLGIDHERFRPSLAPPSLYQRYGLAMDRSYLLYTGSEDPRKNLITLLQALARVRRERPDVHLIKVGRAHFDQQRTRLTDLADELGVRPAIHFLDEVPEEDLVLLYSLADICVMPSLYEGFGFPVLEAMACGTPVVCARAASLPELAGDAALLFDPGPDAADALAAAIRDILEHPEHRQELRHRGRQQASRFRWSTCARQTLAVYRGSDVQGEPPPTIRQRDRG